MTAHKDLQTLEIREKILEAARQRFCLYGYNKTTMAEIAKDCDMSAANLYRFFENKLDIAATLSGSCIADKESTLNETTADASQPASTRLRDYIFETLHQTYKQSAETPRLNEMINAVCESRMDLVEQHMDNKMQILTRLIMAGNETGEFSVTDTQQTADAILTATTLFEMPILTPLFSLEKLEKKAEHLTELILNGIKKR